MLQQPPPGFGAPTNYTQQQLSVAGRVSDRNQLTRAGRAFQKHRSRGRGTDWDSLAQRLTGLSSPTKAEEHNIMGQALLDYIISDVNTVWFFRRVPTTGQSIEARLPNGLGARWDATTPLVFRTFLD